MKKLLSSIPTAILAFIIYVVYTGSLKIYDIITGLAVALLVGFTISPLLINDWRKALDMKRLFIAIKYALRYFLIDEVKAHIEVIKLGFSPRMPIKPGIVRVPYTSSSEYALTAISLSITNTPGTVVVDFDKERKILYVNWIYVKSTSPEENYKHIVEVFDKYAKKIFD
ncbi:MAG: Na+/H+ antiporter subunit E [Desulfurococcaceae archaeon]